MRHAIYSAAILAGEIESVYLHRWRGRRCEAHRVNEIRFGTLCSNQAVVFTPGNSNLGTSCGFGKPSPIRAARLFHGEFVMSRCAASSISAYWRQ
jgi:hypothetical protein